MDKNVANVLGKKSEVNSYHNNAMIERTVSSELKIFAKAPDGIVEGIYHPKLSIAAIQWHPERKSPDEKINEKINEKIVRAFLNRELFWNK